MPETACLHIQSHESDPIRVVELPGVSVRIGRGSYCEVRLPEPSLAEEECHLRRRGSTWHLVPVASPCAITIEGRAVERPRPLPYGMPLRAGDHWLTLRPVGASPPEWGHAQAPTAIEVPSVAALAPEVPRPVPQREPGPGGTDDADHLASWRSRQESLLRASQEEKRWEARWKAVGEKLRSGAPTHVSRPAAPAAPLASERPEGWGAVELPRREGAPVPSSSAARLDTTEFLSVKAVATPPMYPPVAKVASPPKTPTTVVDVAPPKPPSVVAVASPPKYAPVKAVEPPAARVPFVAPEALSLREPVAPFPPLAERTPSPAGHAPSQSEAPWPPWPTQEEPLPDGEMQRVEIAKTSYPPSPARVESWPIPPLAREPEAPSANRPRDDRHAPMRTLGAARPLRWPASNPAPEVIASEPAACPPALAAVSEATAPEPSPVPSALKPLDPPAPQVPHGVEDDGLLREEAAAASPLPDSIRQEPRLPAEDARVISRARFSLARLGWVRLTGIFRRRGGQRRPDEDRDTQSDTAREPVPSSEVEGPRSERLEPSPSERETATSAPEAARSEEATAALAESSPTTPAPVDPQAPCEPECPGWPQQVPFVTDTGVRDTGGWSGVSVAVNLSTTAFDAAGSTPRAWNTDPAGGRARPQPVPIEAPTQEEHPAPRPFSRGEPGRTGEFASAREWPSARDILAAHQARLRPKPKSAARPTARRRASRPVPTVVTEPEHWKVPLWLGWLPLTVTALAVGVGGVGLTWEWSKDAKIVGIIANHLAQSKPRAKATLKLAEIPSGPWWKSTAGNLAHLAVALGISGDPSLQQESRALLNTATQASPLQPTARFALAHLPGRDGEAAPLAQSLGLSHDVVALAWSGHQLLKAGKKDEALKAYRAALELAATAEVERLAPPSYNEDPQFRRYALPGEDLIGLVVSDMAEEPGATYADWSAALPRFAVAPLVAARVLRERNRLGSDAALDAIVAQSDQAPPAGAPAALHLAAQAEAFAWKSEWAKAEALYKQAIDLMPAERVRRSWWVNVADIALRRNDDTARQKALDAANNHDPKDEISQCVMEIQKSSGYPTEKR